MITFTEGNTDATALVTLNEKRKLENPYYLFVFSHAASTKVFKIIRSADDDISDYPDRNNEFQFNVVTDFEDAPEGFYNYTIYEQESSTNTDETLTGSVVEIGKMKMIKTTLRTDYKEYRPVTTYHQYEG